MLGIDKLEKMQELYDGGFQVEVIGGVKELISSHIETCRALGKALRQIEGLEAKENDDTKLSDEVVSLSYWLAKELGAHVDDLDDHNLTLIVERLIQKRVDEIPRLPDVVYLAWPNPEKAQFERKSRPSENPALGVAVFVTELEALRFANDADVNYRVTCAPFGLTINQAKYDRDAQLVGLVDAEKKEPF